MLRLFINNMHNDTLHDTVICSGLSELGVLGLLLIYFWFFYDFSYLSFYVGDPPECRGRDRRENYRLGFLSAQSLNCSIVIHFTARIKRYNP